MAVVDQSTFNSRLATCNACPYWKLRKCTRGHSIRSLLGCPQRKFPPIGRNSYAKDNPIPESVSSNASLSAPPQSAKQGGCGKAGGCGGKVEPKPVVALTAAGAVHHFLTSMKSWSTGGFKLVDGTVHERRQAICRACPHFSHFQCKKCGCVVMVKTKLASEHCPDNPPRW